MNNLIKQFLEPDYAQWPALVARNKDGNADIEKSVAKIIEEVRLGGDSSLRSISGRIDGYSPESFEVSPDVINDAAAQLSSDLKTAICNAKANIEAFHKSQMPKSIEVETVRGVKCSQRPIPIKHIGIYIPGGKAPLFSTVLMLAVPAAIAGCESVIMCTPADRNGRIAPEILYSANLCGVNRIFTAGGAQAIAAMTYGTETIPKVDKIFGPGNKYVTCAKQMVGGREVAIDIPAGPSEVMVMADETAVPKFVAADLLSQAEHGQDSQAMLVCSSREIAERVLDEIEIQIRIAHRANIIRESLSGSRIIIFRSERSMTDFANAYAPEHLIISMRDPWSVASNIKSAGSVFIGNYSTESAGDYASGTNHTLPTDGWARSFSGVNIDSYMKKITFQEITEEGLELLSPVIIQMAMAEGLDAHANAVRVRLNSIQKTK